ncbi:hypothetical protein [Kitasatospora aureofaciens]|uniref:hypothetical protein n=1 Tax=Kitasatospora aureofaciens TaxID=1894 RepID=UPI0033E66225
MAAEDTTPEVETAPDEDLDARAVLRAIGPIAVLGGSVVLIKLLLALLVRALRAAANLEKEDKPDDAEEGEEKPKAKAAKGRGKAKAKGRPVGDTLEGVGIAALCVAGAVGTGGSMGALLWVLLAPWRGYVIGVLIVAWYLAAAGVNLERARHQAAAHEDAEDGEEHAAEEEDEDDDGEWEYYDDEDEEAETENDHETPGEYHSPVPAAITFPQAEEALMRHIFTEVLEAVKAGRKGVHLSTLVEAMPPGWDVSLLRMVLARYRVPVQKMQIRGIGNTWGIHIDAVKRAYRFSPEECLAKFAEAPEPHLIKTTFWPEQVAARAAAPTAPGAPAQTPAQAAPAAPAPAPAAPPAPAVQPAPATSPAAPPVPAPAAPPVEAPVLAAEQPAMARILHLVKGSSPDQVA